MSAAAGVTRPCSADELRALFLFERLTDDQLAWLCREGRGRAPRGLAWSYTEGEPATCCYVLLDGTVVLSGRVGGDDVEVVRTSAARRVRGRLLRRYLGDQVPQVYTDSLAVTEPSRFFVLDAAKFAQMMHQWFPMARAPAGGAVLRHPQHPAGQSASGSGCSRSARCRPGSTHELNNPAAAAVSATAALRERVAGMRHKLGMIADAAVRPGALASLVGLQEEAAERVAKALR